MEKNSKSFEIVNTKSGTIMGVWEAVSASEALDKYAQDAGLESFEAACEAASGDDIEAREIPVSVDDDLCEKWLGRDWPDSATPAEAMRIAETCQEKADSGDSRDYATILAEVLAEDNAAIEARRDRVRRAIQASAAFTRIEHIEADALEIDDLVADFAAMWHGDTDSVETSGVVEVWGWDDKTPPNGHAWRVEIQIK